MLRCKLSNQVVVDPVITPCHHIFERKLIEDYISNSSACPICGQTLTTQDLYTVDIDPVDSYPATIRAPSFSSLLTALQSEYDSMQFELHSLRTKLATAQRELAQALYENDAAKRVIARLLAEKNVVPVVQEEELNEMNEVSPLKEYFLAEGRRLIKLHKRGEKENERNSEEIFRTFNVLNPTRRGPILNNESTFTAIDRFPNNDILLGAANGLVLGINISSGTPKEFASFDSPVVSLFTNSSYSSFIGADKNGTILYASLTEGGPQPVRKETQKSIVEVMLHPREDHAIVFYSDGVIEIFTVPSFDSVLSFNTGSPITMASLHTDGIFGLVANNQENTIKVIELAAKSTVAQLSMPGEITALALPRSNSRYVAAACSSAIRIFDLNLPSEDKIYIELPFGSSSLAFDATSFILGVLSPDGDQVTFVQFDRKGSFSTGRTIDIGGGGKAGRFSCTDNFFAVIGEHDNVDLITSHE
ncbi:WD-repeat protein [Tritrichomonas foetus]|uniref:Pre-mRNA-processing factor 19 n=1 Tax=Tritrichomonas foetus TaxID=1144522 RepID=A0A1J4KEP4_9EUKA|nr:WD-repeat protein [Tritrichomonas foetus]|eukprot:OHT09400.1 WD-repeat protein [Tritrichomonas foetus]